MNIKGKVHKYGSDINTDAIIPAKFLNVSEPRLLAQHCMEGLDLDFATKVKPGDIMVATTNFGCGSSREHAPIAIKAAGVAAVVAESFARIFYRNAINIGLPILECPEAVKGTDNGDTLEIDLSRGIIKNVTKGTSFQAKPYPDFMMELINNGGLVEYTKKRLARSR